MHGLCFMDSHLKADSYGAVLLYSPTNLSCRFHLQESFSCRYNTSPMCVLKSCFPLETSHEELSQVLSRVLCFKEQRETLQKGLLPKCCNFVLTLYKKTDFKQHMYSVFRKHSCWYFFFFQTFFCPSLTL